MIKACKGAIFIETPLYKIFFFYDAERKYLCNLRAVYSGHVEWVARENIFLNYYYHHQVFEIEEIIIAVYVIIASNRLTRSKWYNKASLNYF